MSSKMKLIKLKNKSYIPLNLIGSNKCSDMGHNFSWGGHNVWNVNMSLNLASFVKCSRDQRVKERVSWNVRCYFFSLRSQNQLKLSWFMVFEMIFVKISYHILTLWSREPHICALRSNSHISIIITHQMNSMIWYKTFFV